MTTIASFYVRDDLVMTCFTRMNRLSAPRNGGPLFVVREFDARVIRARSADDSMHTLSEQAKRAGVRSVIMHMGLRLEHGTKDEIQILKSVGVLGRRAPSCSMLCGSDMALLLDAFNKRSVARELRNALQRNDSIRPFDSAKVVRDEDIEAEERRILQLNIAKNVLQQQQQNHQQQQLHQSSNIGLNNNTNQQQQYQPYQQQQLTSPSQQSNSNLSPSNLLMPMSDTSSLNMNSLSNSNNLMITTPTGSKPSKRIKANPLTGKQGRARLAVLLRTGELPIVDSTVDDDDGSYIASVQNNDTQQYTNKQEYDTDSNDSHNISSNNINSNSNIRTNKTNSKVNNPIFDAVEAIQQADNQLLNSNNNNNNSNITVNTLSPSNDELDSIQSANQFKRLLDAEKQRNKKILARNSYNNYQQQYNPHIHQLQHSQISSPSPQPNHIQNNNNNNSKNINDSDSLSSLAALATSKPTNTQNAIKQQQQQQQQQPTTTGLTYPNIGHSSSGYHLSKPSNIPQYQDSSRDNNIQVVDAGSAIVNIPLPNFNQNLLLPIESH